MLKSFHASRFEARTNQNGEDILYEDQDTNLWNQQLIYNDEYYLNRSSRGSQLSKYHLEAAIAYWHTKKNDTADKWGNILQLYSRFLQVEYSPVAALNRTYALSKANGKKEAIVEAEKLPLTKNHFYHSLLGNLYTDIDNVKALQHYQTSLELAKSKSDKATIVRHIKQLAPGDKKTVMGVRQNKKQL